VAERLYRSRHDRMLAGVAAGVADALDADPSLVRIAWALLVIFTGGIAFVVYVVMAIVVPEAPAGSNAMTPPPAGGEPGAASQSIVASGSSDSAGAAPVGAPGGLGLVGRP
jgi:phage shock protein C